MIFDDGSSFVGYSASRVVDAETGRQERSEEQRPADMGADRPLLAHATRRRTCELLDAYERHWKQAFRRHRFSFPPPWGTPDPLEELLDVPGSRIEPVHQFMTLRQLAQDFFESPELQILFMRAATTSTGCFPDDVPGLQGLIHCLPLTLSFEPAAIAVGGSQAITDALVAAGRKLGVDVPDLVRGRPDHGRERTRDRGRARRRVADRGRARGQRPRPARRPCCGCCETSRFDDRLRRRIRNIHYDRGQLLWANLAIHEPPAYRRRARRTRASARSRACTGGRRTSTTCTSRYQPEIFLHGFAQPTVRALLGRQPVGQTAAPRRAAHRRRRGVLRAAPALLLRAVARDQASGSSRTCCASGRATRRT